jgi:hypothetical protein
MAPWRRQPESYEMPMRGELPTITTRSLRAHHPSILQIAWSRVAAVMSDQGLQSVLIFSLIGLLLTLNLALHFPDLGAYYASLPISP